MGSTIRRLLIFLMGFLITFQGNAISHCDRSCRSTIFLKMNYKSGVSRERCSLRRPKKYRMDSIGNIPTRALGENKMKFEPRKESVEENIGFGNLARLVEKAIRQSESPFISEKKIISAEVGYDGPIWDQAGGKNYLRSALEWKRAFQSLPEANFNLCKVSQLSPTEVLVKWNCTWIPPSVLGFAAFGRVLPGIEIRMVDILHRAMFPVTGFTWKKLAYLLKCLSKGFLPVPYAVIEGVTKLEFDKIEDADWEEAWGKADKEDASSGPKSRAFQKYAFESEEMLQRRQNFQDKYDEVSNMVIDKVFDALSETPENSATSENVPLSSVDHGKYRLVRHSEDLSLLDLVRSSRLQNRRIAMDLLSFLDSRKPPSLDVYQWDNIVRERCDLSFVPGMGPLDIDGLDPEAQSSLLESSGAVITFASIIVLVLGVGFARIYFQQLGQEAALREVLSEM